MKSVFQVVATMVLANATVAYGADAKSAVTNIKKGAAATASDAKSKAGEVLTGAKEQASEVKSAVKEAAQDATKKADASEGAAAQPEAAPAVTAQDVKDVAKEAKEAGAEVAKATGPSLIIPESAVLPVGVVRARGYIGSAKATYGFDRDSKKIDLGATIKATAGAGVLEYGLNEKISLQLVVPFRSAAKYTVDNEAKFRDYVKQTSSYNDFRAQVREQFAEQAATLAAAQAKKAALDAGQDEQFAQVTFDQTKAGTKTALAGALAANVPTGQPISLAAVGMGTIGATEKLSDGLDRVLLDKAVEIARTRSVATGLGDVELGARYALSTEADPWFQGVPFYTSVSAGVRFNTGRYKQAAVDNKAAVGRGTTDLGIRLNADYNLFEGLQVQLENQTEFMIAKGKTHKAASVGGVKDYDTGKVYASGTNVDFERKGMRQVGYAKLVIAPGALSTTLNPLKINAKYGYDLDAKVKIDGVEQKDEATKSTNLAVGAGLDGLQMGLPLQLDVDYILPMRGRNVSAANTTLLGTLKLFYKF